MRAIGTEASGTLVLSAQKNIRVLSFPKINLVRSTDLIRSLASNTLVKIAIAEQVVRRLFIVV